MKRFKKRTIALVLASVVTVVGAFGSSNYRNSLTGLSFEGSSGSNINLVVQTKSEYSGSLSPMRKDANTYILMLPEVNSVIGSPDLSNVSSSVASVDIRTMPYSNTAKGYTRITIKTLNPSMRLSTSNQVFLGDNAIDDGDRQIVDKHALYEKTRAQEKEPEDYIEEAPPKKEPEKTVVPKKVGEVVHQPSTSSNTETANQVKNPSNNGLISTPVETAPKRNVKNTTTSNSASDSNNTYLWLWAVLIALAVAFFYVKAKNKMQEIAGEKINIDVDDKPKKDSKRQELKKIKNTIKNLDSAYSSSATIPGKNEYTTSSAPSAPVKTVKPSEELNIVDLDELFQEHQAKTKEEEENEALEDFLSGFSFDEDLEESTVVEEEPDAGYDEEYYEKIINSLEISFSKAEVDCMHQLISGEINDETIKNIDKYAVSCPIEKPISKKEILEDLVTTYTISQNITFTQEDVSSLFKLINVELDKDFITDLRTNPERTKAVEAEIIASGEKPRKASEIITLSVNDMLPDLSEALKKQGNRQIEYARKAETVYFSEGYEVSTLALGDVLPDLSKEIHNKNAYKSKPSATEVFVDDSYVVGNGSLKITSELPDLQDALAHPEKYAKEEKPSVVVDPNILLKNIANVQFKPFYEEPEETKTTNTPSVSDIQAELGQFKDFSIAPEEEIEPLPLEESYDDFQALYSNEYVDLDKEAESLAKESQNIKPIVEPKVESKIEPKVEQKVEQKSEQTKSISSAKPANTVSSKTQPAIKKVDTSSQVKQPQAQPVVQKKLPPTNPTTVKPAPIEKRQVQQQTKVDEKAALRCIIDGYSYSVLSSAPFENNKGCHLAKNESGYAILGYDGDKLFLIKQYQELKSEKIHARLSEQLPNGINRYLIRVGIQKLIVNVKEDAIEYVMDLC